MRGSGLESAHFELRRASGHSRDPSPSLYHYIFVVAGGSKDVKLFGYFGIVMATEYCWGRSMSLWGLVLSTISAPSRRQNPTSWGSPVSIGVRERRNGDEMEMYVWTRNRAISGYLELSHYSGLTGNDYALPKMGVI